MTSWPQPVVLPPVPPSQQGVDARGLISFLDAMDAAPDVELHSLMVLRHGRLLASGWWAPYTPEGLQLLYSLSKSFTSTALGLAVGEGLLSLDDLVVDLVPGGREVATDERVLRMRVRHLAAMASGHHADTWERVMRADRADPVRAFLQLAPEGEPGTVFAYNQSCTYTIATIVQRLTGGTLVDYLRPRLLDPLGIGPVAWKQHPDGVDLGFSGLHAQTEALARLGQLYLQGGVWQGRRLLAADWVEQATRVQVANPDEANVDWRQGYGFQFWMARHGFRGDGAYGQFAVVLPEQDMVVAITAQTENMQAVLDGLWAHLLPAVGSAPDQPQPATAEDRLLAERLSGAALAPVDAGPCPSGQDQDWSGPFALEPDGPDGGPELSRVELEHAADGWWLTLVEPGPEQARVRVQVGQGEWAQAGDGGQVPTAVSGGWPAPGTFRADVIFVQTPHRMRLTCTLADRRASARWVTGPLHAARPSSLRAPRAG